MAESVQNKNGIVVINSAGGHTVISQESLLKRLHYFDGKFLRAADLNLEQQALLNQVRLSNQATGSGVVHGYSCTLTGGDRLDVGPGLAIDPAGRVLYLPREVQIGIAELIEKSGQSSSASGSGSAAGTPVFGECEQAAVEAPDTVLEGVRLYLITVGYAEAYCGEEEVYGKLCEEACITSTERPYVIEGVVIRAVPLNLSTDLATSQWIALSSRHLRSRVASAYFAAERSNPASLVSADGLASSIWCLGAEAEGGATVPIGVLARSGSQTVFLDAWIARREKMETPPHRYWAGRLSMRPWNVFLAQVLQFQCQLASCFAGGKVAGGESPCSEEKKLAAEAAEALAELMQKYSEIVSRFTSKEGLSVNKQTLKAAPLNDLRGRLSAIASKVVSQRYLIDCGIVELPSAGYLPVDPTAGLTVNEQVRRLTGDGLDLRFCVVRPDYVPHALEEAQHMERISLLSGIDDPAAKPKVDVLVPDGRIEEYKEEAPGTGYAMDLVLTGVGLNAGTGLRTGLAASTEKLTAAKAPTVGLQLAPQIEVLSGFSLQASLRGAARSEKLSSGGAAFYYAAQTPPETPGFGRLVVPNDVLQLMETASGKTAGNVLELIKSVSAETGKAASISVNELNPAAAANRPLAETKLQRLSSGLRINTRQSGESSQAIWLSLRTDEDPFTLVRGNATPVSAQAVFLYSLPIKNSLLLVVEDFSLNGRLRLDSIAQRGSETHLTCRLKADGILNYSIERNGERSEQAIPLKLDEKVHILRDTGTGSRPAYLIRVVNPSPWASMGNVELRFERSWTDNSTATVKAVFRLLSREIAPNAGIAGNIGQLQRTAMAKEVSLTQGLTVNDAISAVLAKNEVLIFSGQQKIDNAVLKAGNALHSASLSALARLGAAQDDSGFADFSARQLFPPPKAVPDELRVFARRDWVLFHRRRDKVCGFETAPESLVQPRRFRVFQAEVANEKESVLLRDALVNNRPEIISRFQPQAVTIVEFEAGIQAVRTSADDVRADWQARVDDDADIVLGVVATSGAAYDESQVLAEARLNSLTEVLAPVAELAGDAELLWAEQIPETLASGEVDGVIVYATQQVATICHEVFRLELAPERFGAFLKKLQATDNFRGLILELGGAQLGYVPKFRSGAAQLFGDTAPSDLVKAWGDAGNNQPIRVVPLLPVDADGNLPTDQPYMAQSQAIADTVGKGADPTDPIGLSQPFLKCPAVTLLIVEPQASPTLNAVYGYVAPAVSVQINPDDVKTLLETEGLSDDFPASHPDKGEFWYPLGAVSFDADNNGNLKALNAVTKTAIANGLLTSAGYPLANRSYFVFSLSKQGADAIQVSREKAEAEQIAGALNLPANVTAAAHGKAFWPVSSDAMTLVLIPNQTYLNTGDGMTHRVLYAASADTSPTDEAIITSGIKTLHYNREGELIKDLAFEAFVARLKKEDTLVKTIEVVTVEESVTGSSDPQAEKTLTALKEAGVAEASATVSLRVADATEKALLSALGSQVKSGLVLRK